jgi:FlaA1/EpsC-like NDP-sugar epimerase
MSRTEKAKNYKKFFLLFVADVVIFIVSVLLSFLLRFDFHLPLSYSNSLIASVILFPIIKSLCFFVTNLYKISWEYVGIKDMYNLIKASVVSTLLLSFLILFNHTTVFAGFPRSVLVIDLVFTLLFASGLRFSKRMRDELIKFKQLDAKPTLIIGAGDSGETAARDLLKNKIKSHILVGFLDDEEERIGTFIHNVKVLGKINDLESVARSYNIQSIVIAIPSLEYKKLQDIYHMASGAGINDIKVVPRLYTQWTPELYRGNLEEVKMEDLLGRKQISVDYLKIKSIIEDKVVLVTGAGGSIGSEIAYQLCSFSPAKLILFEIDETEIFNLENKLKDIFPFMEHQIITKIGDIKDMDKLKRVFEKHQPQIVFHAAAYKHVPLMERFPEEAVKTNIVGTYNLCSCSVKFGVEKFVNISTDKAVNPVSVMGATKKMAEIICSSFNKVNGTDFVSVRFGNVLGSRGSVLHIFVDQIKNRKPVTITHPDMKRYFMTIPEAVLLVFQASTMGNGGEVFVLDMGEPIEIKKLVIDLAKIMGVDPEKELEIKYIGLRAGEKLTEELLTNEEGTNTTSHNKIYIAQNGHTIPPTQLKAIVSSLEKVSKLGGEQVSNMLFKYLKEINYIAKSSIKN